MPRPKYRSRQRLASLGAALLLVLLLTDGCAVSDRKEPAPSPLDGVLSLYQGPLNHLSAVRAGGCPMHPSCSVYARQALAQHGPIVGGMMTTDRLLRLSLIHI